MWLPWDGNPTPSVCDTNRSIGAPHGGGGGGGGEIGSFDHINGLGGETCYAYGWTSGPVRRVLYCTYCPISLLPEFECL
eukprot:COSAG03_NODE_14_length_22296_cov_10.813128_3_plen_79_part_00